MRYFDSLLHHVLYRLEYFNPIVCRFISLQKDANSGASIFTAEEEIFAFDRTKSRLSEMQTEQYWSSEGQEK